MTAKALITLLAALCCAQADFSVRVISRAEWGGRQPTNRVWLNNYLSYAVIHHTAGAYCSTKASCAQQMRNIQSYHMDSLGWPDIGYNFLIGGDGQVYEGRGWNSMGAHASNWNGISIGISFMGNYNNDRPTAAQIAAAKGILADAVARGQISSGYILYGHCQVGATECPGNNLFAEIRSWPHYRG
ncbi:peptidoglycan-recognition protein SC2-like [Bactrocera tryoni]|uniref:peptidoglycan-recognition protein SC2-like n=1 Tax=Bactrocera tryoni TaxID=59916 RepID=UPI001A9695C3|nr:peptidoglycan-recognition protein SC2-like [Bactrocera tryoni]